MKMSNCLMPEAPATNGAGQLLEAGRVCRLCDQPIPDGDRDAIHVSGVRDSTTEFFEDPCPFSGEAIAKWEPTGEMWWECRQCQIYQEIYHQEHVAA